MFQQWAQRRRRFFHHPRTNYAPHGHPGYGLGRHYPRHPPGYWNQEARSHDYKGGHNVSESNGSTFEEVESLCLSKSSTDSFGQFHSLQRHGVGGSHPAPGHSRGRGHVPGGRFLSRQSSTTSTSTSSGNPPDLLERQSASTNVSGSLFEDNMETLDPRQQFDLNDQALLDGIFRRVLEWNNTHAAMGMGRGRPGGSPGDVLFPQVPPGSYPPGTFSQPSGGFLPHYPPPPGPAGVNPYSRPLPSAGRRVPDVNKEKTLSPSSDITHVKKRRDLILPDEEDESPMTWPYNRKPDGSPRGMSQPQRGSSAGTSSSSLSSKMPSSDSLLSSISQTQEQGWREQLAQGWREGQQIPWRDQTNHGWADPYYPWPGAEPSHPVWKEHQMLSPSTAPGPLHAGMPPAFSHLSSPVLDRGMSAESMTSFGLASPPDTFVPPPYRPTPHRQNTAEVMLMNLGFGGSADGFLPERFLRDWYNKLSRAQSQVPMNQSHSVDSASSSPYGSTHNLHHPRHARVGLPSKPSYEDLRSASDLHRRITNPLNRAATFSASHDFPDTPMATLPPQLGKESRTDRLKEYIEAHAKNVNNTGDCRAQRVHQWASSRQKSLPSYLETLTEEDEAKTRTNVYRPQQERSRLHAFLRENSFSEKTEESQGTSSGGASNSASMLGSESDSVSGSDHHDLDQKRRQRLFTSREPPALGMGSATAPVTTHGTIIGQQGSSHVEQTKSDLKTQDNVEMACTPKKGRKHEHRPRLNSPKRISENPHHRRSPQTTLQVHSSMSEDKASLSDNPARSGSPKKEGRAKSPSSKSRSPGHRSRSPRHHRGRSPCKDLKTKPVSDDILKAKAPVSSFEDSSSSSSPNRRKHPSPANSNKRSNSHSEREYPTNNLPSSLPVQSPSEKPNDREDNQSAQRQPGSSAVVIPTVQGEQRDISDTETQVQRRKSTTKPDKAEPLISTESLEVADIFHNQRTNNSGVVNNEHNGSCKAKSLAARARRGQIEPAMISIVLEDVDGNMTHSGIHSDEDNRRQIQHQQSEESGQQEVLLPIPPSSSSLSLSPIPQSPVTVIEVSLDNQQDSIDTEEGTSSSKELNEEEVPGVDNYYLQTMSSVHGKDSAPGEFPLTVEMCADRGLSCGLPLHENFVTSTVTSTACGGMRDVSVEADDGQASPVLLFSTPSPVSFSSSSSPSLAAPSSCVSEIGIQSDDSRLTPLVSIHHEEVLSALVQNDVSEELYLVSDQGVQCNEEELPGECQSQETSKSRHIEDEVMLEMAHKVTQTNRLVRYEMSSQTEVSLQSEAYEEEIPKAVPSDSRTEPLIGFQSSSDYISDFQCLDQVQNINNKTLYQPRPHSPFSNHAGSGYPEMTRTPSFDSEFWECLGLEVPLKLRHHLNSTHPHRNNAFPYPSVSHPATENLLVLPHHRNHDKNSVYTPHDDRTLFCPHSDYYNATDRIAKHCRLESDLSPSEEHSPAISVKLGSLLSDSSEEQSSQDCVSPDHMISRHISRTASSSGLVEHKAVNTCVTMPTGDFSEAYDSSLVVESFRFSARPLTQDKGHYLSEEQHQDSSHHVSILSFSVDDYRAPTPHSQCSAYLQECAVIKGPCSIIDGSGARHSTPNRKVSDLQSVQNTDEQTRDVSVLQSSGLTQQSYVSHLVEHTKPVVSQIHFSLAGDRSPENYPLMSTNSRTSPGPETDSTGERSDSLSTGLVTAERKMSVLESCDRDFSSNEEARNFILNQLLLTGSKQSKPSVQTVIDTRNTGCKEETSQFLEQRNGHPPDVQKIANRSDEETTKILDSTTVDCSFNSAKYANVADIRTFDPANDTVMCCENQGQWTPGVVKMNGDTSENVMITGHDALGTPTFNSCLSSKHAVAVPSIAPDSRDQNNTDSEQTESGFPPKTKDILNSCHVEDRCTDENTEERTQKQSDRNSWLLDTFVHSLIESACHKLQADFMENKVQWANRMQNGLQPSGDIQTENGSGHADVYKTHADISDTVRFRNKVKDSDLRETDCDEKGPEGDCFKLEDQCSGYHTIMSGTRLSSDFDDMHDEVSQQSMNSITTTDSGVSVVSVDTFRYDPENLLPEVEETEHDQQGLDDTSYLDNHKARHMPVQNLVQIFITPDEQPAQSTESDIDAISPSMFQLQVTQGHGLGSRTLSSDSLNSLLVNISESFDEIDDLCEEENEADHSQRLQSVDVHMRTTEPSSDGGGEVTSATQESAEQLYCNNCTINTLDKTELFETIDPEELPALERNNCINTESQDTEGKLSKPWVGDDGTGTSDSLSPSQRVCEDPRDLAEQRLSQDSPQYSSPLTVSGTIPGDELGSQRCKNSWIQLSNSVEIEERDFEALLLLGSDLVQGAYTGRRFGDALSEIAEEDGHSELTDDLTVERSGELTGELTEELTDELADTEDTADRKAELYERVASGSSGTQSSQGSSVELSSEGPGFGIEISLQPLPSEFSPGKIVVDSLPAQASSKTADMPAEKESEPDLGTKTGVEEVNEKFLSAVEEARDSKVSVQTQRSSSSYVKLIENSLNPDFSGTGNRDLVSSIPSREAVTAFSEAENIKLATTNPDSDTIKYADDLKINNTHIRNHNSASKTPEFLGMTQNNIEDSETVDDQEVSHIFDSNISSCTTACDSSTHVYAGCGQPDSNAPSKGKPFSSSAATEQNEIQSKPMSIHTVHVQDSNSRLPRPLSATARRDAFNNASSVQSGIVFSKSISEDNPSSPPPKCRDCQTPVSRECRCIDSHPQIMTGIVPGRSLNSGTDSDLALYSVLQIPQGEESSVSEDSESGHSPLATEACVMSRSQLAVPATQSLLRSNSPVCDLASSMDYLSSPGSDSFPSPGVESPGLSPVLNVMASDVDDPPQLAILTSKVDAVERSMSPSENMSYSDVSATDSQVTRNESQMSDNVSLSAGHSSTCQHSTSEVVVMSGTHSPSPKTTIPSNQSTKSDKTCLSKSHSPSVSSPIFKEPCDALSTISEDAEDTGHKNLSLSPPTEDSVILSVIKETNHSPLPGETTDTSQLSSDLPYIPCGPTVESAPSPVSEPQTESVSVEGTLGAGDDSESLSFSLTRSFYCTRKASATGRGAQSWSERGRESLSRVSPIPSLPSVTDDLPCTSNTSSQPILGGMNRIARQSLGTSVVVQSEHSSQCSATCTSGDASSDKDYEEDRSQTMVVQDSSQIVAEQSIPETIDAQDSPQTMAIQDSSQQDSPQEMTIHDKPQTKTTQGNSQTVVKEDIPQTVFTHSKDRQEKDSFSPKRGIKTGQEALQPVQSNPVSTSTQLSSGANSSAVVPSLKLNPLAALRRSRFRNPQNTFSVQQKSDSSDSSCSENDALPRRKFFWSTDMRTVVSPVQDSGSDSAGNSQPGDPDVAASPKSSSPKEPLSPGPSIPAKPRSPKSQIKQERASEQIQNHFELDKSSKVMPDGGSDDSTSKSHSPSPDQNEVKLGHGSAGSPSSKSSGMNGLRNCSRSVRELARQFEERGKNTC